MIGALAGGGFAGLMLTAVPLAITAAVLAFSAASPLVVLISLSALMIILGLTVTSAIVSGVSFGQACRDYKRSDSHYREVLNTPEILDCIKYRLGLASCKKHLENPDFQKLLISSNLTVKSPISEIIKLNNIFVETEHCVAYGNALIRQNEQRLNKLSQQFETLQAKAAEALAV